MHAAVAAAIEAAHGDDLDQQSALLAHHWEQAADLVQAVHWHRRAAEWAGARDPVEGLRHWRRVRELGRDLTDRSSQESRLRACSTLLAGGGWRLGMSDDEVDACMGETRALAQALGQPAAVAVALSGVAGQRCARGAMNTAGELIAEARAMLHDDMNLSEIFAIEISAYWLLAGGRLALAREVFERVVHLSRGDPHLGRELVGFSPLIWAEHLTGTVLALTGRFDLCWPQAERAIRRAREHGAQENLSWALGCLSVSAYLAGGTSGVPVPDLRLACVEAVEIADGIGSLYSRIFSSLWLAIAYVVHGDYAAGEDLLTESLSAARAAGTGLEFQGLDLAVFADSCRARGDLEAAIGKAREGIEVSDVGGMWFQAALARAALVDALIVAHAPAHDISALLAEAHELVHQSGGNSLLPCLREAQARLDGRRDQALLAAGLREAAAMYRAMGAPDPAARLAQELAVIQ